MASGVVYYDADGVEQFQPAEVVILACNGIGTPRILLNSASARFPERAGEFQRPGRQEPDVPSLCPDLRLFRRAARRLSRSGQLHLEPGVLRNRPLARVRARLHLRILPRPGAGDGRGARHGDRPPALGRRPSSRVSQAVPSPHRHGGDLRGPAGGAQQCHARSGAEGFQRHSGAEDRLHAEREQPPHAGSRGGARHRDPAGRRRARCGVTRRRWPTAAGI